MTNTYSFITPSDPITFKAENDKVAIAVALLVGNGKAGCHKEDDTSLPTMYLFHPDPMPEIEKDLGQPLDNFIETNKQSIKESLASFAYGRFTDRVQYDKALECITDDAKREEFKKTHEDEQRTSMSTWVKYAWDLAEEI